MDWLNNEVLAAIIGVFLGYLLTKYANKNQKISYMVNTVRIGFSEQHQVFGEISVLWQGQRANNLFHSVVSIKNESSVDFTDFKFRIYTGEQNLLLSDSSWLVQTTLNVPYSEDFQTAIAVQPDSQPSNEQRKLYGTRREYYCKTLNRGQTIEIRVLSTVPNSNETPYIFVDLVHPGVKLIQKYSENEFLGVPMSRATFWGVILTLVWVIFASVWLLNPWLISFSSAIIGLMAILPGAIVCRLIKVIFEKLNL